MPQIYRLLTGKDDSEFCHKVSKALSEGWQLHGSPTMAFDPGKNVMACAQAVVKESDEDYDTGRKLGSY